MGEAKRRAERRRRFLIDNPRCIYCGGTATTVEHCPPRCAFVGRQWPETYEFPACEACNGEGRLDEQAIGLLVRMRLPDFRTDAEFEEWRRLADGIRNNQPALLAEWKGITRNQEKHALRHTFGSTGDAMRHEGWGVMNFGPLTDGITNRFMIRLSKALYYKHNQKIFEGVIYSRHVSLLHRDATPEAVQKMLSGAPALSTSKRRKDQLIDQFIYRFNHHPEHGVLYAVVQFNEQFIFQLIVLSWDMVRHLDDAAAQNGSDISGIPRYEFRLPSRETA